MELTPDNPINQVPKPEFSKSTGKPVAPKIKTPAQVRSLYQSDWDADRSNRLTRAIVQGMLEGKPPYDPKKMADAGLAGCCNIDWRYGQKAIRDKMKPYVMALNSLPVFMNIRTKFGSPSERTLWGRLMSDNHAKLLRSWESFHFRYQYAVLYKASHGVAFGYFNDHVDWRWHVSTLGEMVVPRLSKADASEFARMSMAKPYEPSYLWDQIKEAVRQGWEWTRPKTKDGWHVESVKQAIRDATHQEFFSTDDYEKNEMLWKNKETVYSQSAKVCDAIIMWTKEDDGTVSQNITSKKALKPLEGKKKGEEQFLYKRAAHFQSMRQGVVTFARDIGTNGHLHSIRGTGSDIYPIVAELNKMECAAYDAMKVEMSIPVEATEEVWNSESGYVQAGPFLLLRPGFKTIDRSPRNFSNSVFPGMQMLRANLADQSGSSKMPEQPGNKVDMEGLLESISEIDAMESVLHGIAWQRLLRESLRRLVNIKTSEQPGGPEALEWRRMCKEDGVPDQAIEQIDIESCTAMTPIGNGSPQARMFTMGAMEKLVPFFDEQGRNNYVRDSVASLPGMTYEMVDRYAPQEADLRPTEQVRFARMENVLLKGGADPESDCAVLPNDDHITHLENHAPAMDKIVAEVDEGMLEMEEAVRPLFPLYVHASQHIELCMENPILKNQVAAFRMAMHNVGEIITNGQRKLEAREQKRLENEAKGLDADGNPLPGAEGEGGERPIFPDPTGSGMMLTASEYQMVARTQIHLSDAARNAANAQELHRIRAQDLREQAIDKKIASQQKRQLADLKTAVALTK
jgi:hypothetical protein